MVDTPVAAPAEGPDFDRLVPRPRIVEGLLAARSSPLVLIKAPAGYGKSSSIRLWEREDRRKFCWLVCESRHDDPATLIEAIEAALVPVGELGPQVSQALGGLIPDLVEAGERLGRALGEIDEPFVLAIDNAQLLAADGVWEVIGKVIESLPEKSQLVLATRSQPDLHLGRLRANRQLYELGLSELAMTKRVSRELLSSLDLDISDEDADLLHSRTEGWPAALYLAGLVLRQGGESRLPADSFDGGDRLVVEYFRDEFFQEQSAEEARFLYMTSVLDELSGPLCDAVTGRTDSADVLWDLSRSNSMVIPVDRQDTRFRYHHLFADMLLSELHRREPEAEAEAHLRAARWYAVNGDIKRAIAHAIPSGDHELAGALIWLDFPDTSGRGRLATFDRWLEEIGPAKVATTDSLIMSKAHRELAMQESAAANRWRDIAVREIGEDSPLYGDVQLLKSTYGVGGVEEMEANAVRAAELLSLTNPWQAPAQLYRGVALLLKYELEEANEILAEAARNAAAVSPIIHTLALSELALVLLEQGQADEAWRQISHARSQVERHGLSLVRVVSVALAVSAMILSRQGKIDAAESDLARSRSLGSGLDDFVPWYDAQRALCESRVELKLGHFEAAETAFAEGVHAAQRMPGAVLLDRWTEEIRENLDLGRSNGDNRLNLTAAELRTLQFLPSHHSFRAIGAQLHLSQNTVKTQANSLYRKLGVNSRAEAVIEGRRLGLLDEGNR